MRERAIHLKIKVKSLASEARIIRKEAKKTSGDVKYGLNAHRTSVVRPQARASLLAYGILRGVPYCVMERSCRYEPDFNRVIKMATSFGARGEQCDAWRDEAERYCQNSCSGKAEAA